MTDLETLYRAETIGREYFEKRHAKITEIAEYICDQLVDPYEAEIIAEQIMSDAEQQERLSGETVHGEIRACDSKSGNPVPFTI